MAQEPTQKKPGLLELLDEWEKQGASDAEITQRMNRYLDSKARKEGVPIHGTFELTPLCNLDCKMCYVHLSEKQLRESGKRLLTVDEWKDIMQQAIDAGMMSAILTGGECLSYHGFDELYLFLSEQGIEVTVKTNGLLLTEERIAFFRQHPPLDIVVTLYGADEATYEKVTGRRLFAKAIAGIKRAIEADFYVVVCITPNRFMLENVEALFSLAESLGCPVKVNIALYDSREETGRGGNDYDLTEEEYFRLYRLLAKMPNEVLPPSCAEDIPKPNQDGRPVIGLPCGGGRSSFAIHWDGVMHPCLMLDDIQADVKDSTFDICWEKIGRGVRNHIFPGECLNCAYRPLCPVCVVQHGMSGSFEHANKKFCRRAVRLLQENLVQYKHD